MSHLKITKGLDIPIAGKPEGVPQFLTQVQSVVSPSRASLVGLDLTSFDQLKFRVLVKLGDKVKLGQPLAEDKQCPGRFFVSPAGGVIQEIRRGVKRRLLDIVIKVADTEEIEQFPVTALSQISRLDLIEKLKLGGLFTHIRQRPFNFLADPSKMPRSIFIKAIESAPFTPSSEMQIEGLENEFQEGLNALKKLTEGQINLIYSQKSKCKALIEAKNVSHHTVEGPHPVSNPSLHIEWLDPIRTPEDIVWVVSAHAVVAIGYFLLHGHYFIPRIVSVAGPGVIEGRTGFFKVREGYPISELVAGRLKSGLMRILSGNPLTGHQVTLEDYLGFDDTVISVIPEHTTRKFLHFFRPGAEDFTASGAYLTGHLDNSHREYEFTTSQHGEERPFIDPTLYNQVMPLNISTIHLVKAVMAEDYDLAAELGLLEVDSEDFALTSFVCPSKIPMMDIIKKGLNTYAKDTLS